MAPNSMVPTVATATEPILGRQRFLARAVKRGSFVTGLVIVSVILAIAILAPIVAWHDPILQDITARRLPPIWHAWLWDDTTASWSHFLGTDRVGRDYWARLAYGARISLLIGLLATFTSAVIGITLGVCAGYFGGRVDLFVNLVVTSRLSLPVVLVALAAVAKFGSGIHVVTLVLGLLLWDRFAVVARAATQRIRSLEFIESAEAVGCSPLRIVVSEVLPNILGVLIVVATIEVGNAILYEAALSFLGLGLQPPTPSWGLMLSEAKEDMFFSPWMITIPGVALFALVLGVNMLGDGFRDAFADSGER